ncbi:MAG: hypothetical protein ACKOE6_09040, partial [Flammeovirgaceae bacterium]
QGLIDRTNIFQPLPKPIRLFDSSAIEEGLVKLIYDDELTLPSGRKPFWDYIAHINSKIDFGSRIVLTDSSYFFREKFEGGYTAETKTTNMHHSDRLDERYGDGSRWSVLPPEPKSGIYQVEKGYKTQTLPIWAENPYYDPNKYETERRNNYDPSEHQEKSKRQLKSESVMHPLLIPLGDSRFHTESVYMTIPEQIKYYGKRIGTEDSVFNSDEHDRVEIPSNPKQICIGYEDKPVPFKCIRYNPKDKVGEYGMFRRWDDPPPSERKLNLSWKIFDDDAFIINYDEVTVEDIDFYLNSRVDRREYIGMMPMLWEVRNQLLSERESEKDFVSLVQSIVHQKINLYPT